jgi:nucleotide-binding universal stress UspA family protein
MTSTALVPLDGSETAEQAIPYAQALSPDGGGVVLFTVVPEFQPIETQDPTLAELQSAMRPAQEVARETGIAATRTAMDSVKARVADTRLWWGTRVAQGDPAEQILKAVDEGGISFVAMTTHGRGAAGRALYGSVADRVARTSPVPVLLVRPRAEDEVAAKVDIERIFVPLDGSEMAEASLPVALELARRLRIPIHLVQVVDLAYLLAPISPMGTTTGQYEETVSDVRAGARSNLEGVADTLREESVAVDWRILNGSPYFALVDAAQTGDLIVLTSHGRGGVLRWLLGSVAEKLVREAPAPVMIVPSPGRQTRPESKA